MTQDVKAQHTPGPWATPVIAEGTLVEVQSADGERYIAACYFGDPVSEPYLPRHAEACANARLIAAAPELLEALQAVVGGLPFPKTASEYELIQWGCEPTEARNFARAFAAIARATGEQS